MTERIRYEAANGGALIDLKARQMAPVQAIPTPWTAWDEVCMGRGGGQGWALGWYVLAAGKSGGGKTFIAANAAARAIQSGEAVTFHSLEMSWDELAVRIMAIMSGEPGYKLNPGKHFSPAAFDNAHEAMDTARGTLLINRDPMFRLADLLDGMQRMHDEYGSRFHIIDYLQLAWTRDASTISEQITEISHAVRARTKKLNIVTLGLSQFNRETSKNPERPHKEGMMGGSPLENDSDQTLLLDHSRKEPVFNREGRARGWVGWGLLDKNRHGPELDIPLRFDGDNFRIRQRLDDEILPHEVETKAPVKELRRAA